MRHGVDGRKFGRNSSHRTAMFRNMANAVILEEQIVTTLEKALETRRVVDRLITLGKRGSAHAQRLVFDRTRSRAVVDKVCKDGGLASRYGSRPGGYTRVLKMSDRRRGDGAEMAVLELVDRKAISKGRSVSRGPSESASSGSVPEVAADPFKRFRRLFSKPLKSA